MDDEHPFCGQTAIITGASAGIGRETARTLAENGANIVLTARREDRLQALAEEIETEYGVSTLPFAADVSNNTAVETMVKKCIDRFDTIDMLVNNAGTATERDVDIEELDIEQYRSVADVNIDGMFFTTRAALPYLKDSSGTIVFVGSYAGQYPRPGSPVYAASKWWTRGFALSLAGQVGTENVGVTVVNPSEVRTKFGSEFRSEDEVPEELYDPDEIIGPKDVAEAIAFAAGQQQPNAVAEIDLYRRDKLSQF